MNPSLPIVGLDHLSLIKEGIGSPSSSIEGLGHTSFYREGLCHLLGHHSFYREGLGEDPSVPPSDLLNQLNLLNLHNQVIQLK